MTRIPPAECEGKNAVKIEVTKQSFAQRMISFGVEIRVDTAEGSNLETVHLETFDLPEEQTNTGKFKGKDAVLNTLKLKSGTWVPQTELVQVAISRGNLRDRQARAAVRDALDELRAILKDDFEEGHGAGRGGPKQYRIKPTAMPPDHTQSNSGNTETKLVRAMLPECHSFENTVSDSKSFVAIADCQSSDIARVPLEENPKAKGSEMLEVAYDLD